MLKTKNKKQDRICRDSPTPFPQLQWFLCLLRPLQGSDGNCGSSPRKILMGTFASTSAHTTRGSWTPEGLHTIDEASLIPAGLPAGHYFFTFQLTEKLEISSALFPQPTNWESRSGLEGPWRAWSPPIHCILHLTAWSGKVKWLTQGHTQWKGQLGGDKPPNINEL